MQYSSHSAVLALFKKYFLLGEVVYPQTISPESAKAFKLAMSKAFALSGRADSGAFGRESTMD